jgi:hypothetical protein
VNVSTNSNEVTDLGDVEPFGTTQPGDSGIPGLRLLDPHHPEVRRSQQPAIVSDTTEFVGNPNPGFEGNFGSTFTSSNFRIYAQFDWMAGLHPLQQHGPVPGAAVRNR